MYGYIMEQHNAKTSICRCISVGKDEEDYRPLFENFLQDLLATLNRPDWPAAEVLLTLLGRLLVSQLNVHDRYVV